MSNYKVGDLAALFGSKSSKNNLQSLFNERNKKQGHQQAKKKQFEQKEELPASISKSPKKKNKKAYLKATTSSNTLAESVDQKAKRKTKKRPSEKDSNLDSKLNDSGEESFIPVHPRKKQKIDKSNNGATFIRNPKNKKSKNLEQEKTDTALFQFNEPEKLFNEGSENEKVFVDRPKKLKRKKALVTNSLSSPSEDNNEQILSSNVNKREFQAKTNKQESIKDLPCTLFVGNLPVSVNKKMLQKVFLPFGTIKNVRIRGAIPTKLTIPKKVAAIKNEYHDGLHSLSGFVVFRDRDSARKALTLNGSLLDGNHIVVDPAHQVGEKKLYDNQLSVFIGNLPFDVDDEAVRTAFEECGGIQAIRIVRDKSTGVGKGFGYVQFQNVKSKERALTLEDAEVGGRKIRIKPIENSQKTGSKDHLMMIRKNMASKQRSTESGGKKSVKKLLKKGKRLHQKKRIASLFGEKFMK